MLRRQAALDRALALERADRRLHDILRLGAYQLRFLSRIPAHAAVSTSVDLARLAAGEGAAAYVNQALRTLAQGSGALKDTERGAVASHPPWLVARWRRHFGADDAARLVTWNDAKPSLVLQPARWAADTLRDRLQSVGIRVESAPFGTGVRVVGGADRSPLPALRKLPGYTEGGWIVQDPAHALVCRFAAIPQGSLVYDACAAPGGKAVTLERLGARVVAGDARRERIPRLAETVRRSGVAIRVVCADLLAAPLTPGGAGGAGGAGGTGGADAVLVDAPCTATGTMARHPDARWRLHPGAIARAAERQRRMLDAAAACVPAGGLLVYATCSLEPEENEAIVDDFLGRRRDFRRDPATGAVSSELLTPDGDFLALPQRHGMDGAYAARLRRGR